MNVENSEDTQLLMRTTEETNITEYKAAFYKLLAKPDSMTKVYNERAVIDIQDIYELNERICTKLGHYQEAGFIIQASVRFSDGKTKIFPNWRSFSAHTWFEPEAINNMVITWEFNAIFPGLQIPERHTLMVKLSNGLRPEEMLNLVFTGKIEEIEEMDNNLFPIVAYNPLMNYAMSNAVIKKREGLIKIDKDATTKRIDPVDAILCAFKLALYHVFGLSYLDAIDEFLESEW